MNHETEIIIERTVGLGWVPDLPDHRDFDEEHPAVRDLAAKALEATAGTVPDSVDLRSWCSPVENQGRLGSCTAHAAAGIVEYFERRAFGRHVDVSRRFIYKVTRKLLGWTGDTGAYLRTTMAALVLFGAPPEKYWPYTTGPDFDEEPPTFCYAFAQNFQALRYFRHDPPGRSPREVLESVKRYLRSGVPCMFGFSVYSVLNHPEVRRDGAIPMPTRGDRLLGGHAVVAVGYHDHKVVRHPVYRHYESHGALLIRNSWGRGWGERGYGWLPYDYVLRGLARDFWSLLKAEWVDLQPFNL